MTPPSVTTAAKPAAATTQKDKSFLAEQSSLYPVAHLSRSKVLLEGCKRDPHLRKLVGCSLVLDKVTRELWDQGDYEGIQGDWDTRREQDKFKPEHAEASVTCNPPRFSEIVEVSEELEEKEREIVVSQSEVDSDDDDESYLSEGDNDIAVYEHDEDEAEEERTKYRWNCVAGKKIPYLRQIPQRSG